MIRTPTFHMPGFVMPTVRSAVRLAAAASILSLVAACATHEVDLSLIHI